MFHNFPSLCGNSLLQSRWARAVSLVTGLVARIQDSHSCNVTSISGWGTELLLQAATGRGHLRSGGPFILSPPTSLWPESAVPLCCLRTNACRAQRTKRQLFKVWNLSPFTSRCSAPHAGAGPLQTTEHVVRKGTQAKSCPEEAPPPRPLCPGSCNTPLRKAPGTALSPPPPSPLCMM